MVKMLILAIWASAATALASYAAAEWRMSHALAIEAGADDHVYEYRKTRVINVPIIADGALLGYVIMQFLYAIDARAAEKLNVNPEAFILDYAFRAVYGDPGLDFRHLEKYDIGALTGQIRSVANEKLGAGLIKEVLVQDFAYMPKEQAPR
ncbi:hypothetical protein [Rhodoblastus sp.]|jgi:hypothetical protein|uniref:hypothetical protein n=1 Tax=Rhodoblastus sp. TaxID=1962975 RepID=UPI00262740B5|nr:hypothetical protein [Rhodoblastus sp.]